MKQFAAGDLTRNTGDLFEAAAVAPVAITKHRKPRFVVMSVERYETLANSHAASQRAYAVGEMPDDVAALFERGLEDTIHGR